MKKIISMVVVLATLALGASAQERVSGRVTDKKGNPMQGVMVESSTGQNCITDFDGSYGFESPVNINKVTAYYAGYVPKSLTFKTKKPAKNKKKRNNDDTKEQVIKLSKRSWLNSRPENWQFFIGAQGLFDDMGITNGFPGVTVGVIKNFGIYGKALIRPIKPADEYTSDIDELSTGKYQSWGMAFTGGLLLRLGCPIYLNIGGGFYKRDVFVQVYDDGYEWRGCGNMSTECLCADVGLYVKLNKSWMLNAGALVISTDWPENNDVNSRYSESVTKVSINVGLSYCF